MAAEKGITQLFASIPAFKEDGEYSDGGSVVASIFQWFSRGVQAPLHMRKGGESAVFLGKEGKLYEVGKAGDPKEVVHDKEPWHLPDILDLSVVSVQGVGTTAYVLDSQMRLHALRKTSPLQVVLPAHRVVQVECGSSHCLALTSDGRVYGCGENSVGQLGLGSTSSIVADFAAVALPKQQERSRFATLVACGSRHSVAICGGDTVFAFGSNTCGQLGFRGVCCSSCSPVEVSGPQKQRFVKAACGASHTLLLTADCHLWGCGLGDQRQLGTLGTGCQKLQKLPFNAKHGHAVDVWCDPSLDISVVLTDSYEFWVCGQAGSLFNTSGCIEDFLLYDRASIVIDSRVVAMKAVANRVRIPGFNDPNICDVELVSEVSASLREDAQGHSTQASVFVGLDAIKVRSPYLWTLLNSPCQSKVTRGDGRGYSVRLEKYSQEALCAYGKYIHDGIVIAEPHVAMELMELGREYADSGGLAEQSIWRAKQSITPENLLQRLKACIEFGHLSMGVDLVKRGLCVANVCDVLQVTGAGEAGDPQVQYIRNIAMNYATEHATAVVRSERYKFMADAIKVQFLDMLASLELLKT